MSGKLTLIPEKLLPAKAALCLPSEQAGRGWGRGSFIMGDLTDMR